MVTRRAIIIGNESGYDAPVVLKGVKKDLMNYIGYMTSDIGGEWFYSTNKYRTEVVVLHNENRSTILSAIRNCSADYSFIAFSGHGFHYSKRNFTYICVKDGFISEEDLMTKCGRQTLILDCCREKTTITERYESFLGDTGETFEKGGRIGAPKIPRVVDSRQKFNNAIVSSSIGNYHGYSCKIDQTSGDNPLSGGVFTTALINAGRDFHVTNRNHTWLTIHGALERASINIAKDIFTTQRPTYRTLPYNMERPHPFAVSNVRYYSGASVI